MQICLEVPRKSDLWEHITKLRGAFHDYMNAPHHSVHTHTHTHTHARTHVNTHTHTNPWNAIYKTASGKLRSTTCLTTLQHPDGTFTLDTESTAKHTLDYFVPEDNEINDSAVHKQIRELINEPIDTDDDKPFSQEEIASVIKTFN